MDDIGALIAQLLWVLLLLVPWLLRAARRVSGRGDQAEGAAPTSRSTPAPPPTAGSPVPAPSPEVTARQLDGLLDGAYQMSENLQRRPAHAPLLRALQADVIAPLEGAREHREHGLDPRAIEALADRLRALRTLRSSRPDDGTLDLLVALERVAADLSRPLRAFADAQGVPFAGGDPVIVPGGTRHLGGVFSGMELSVYPAPEGFGQRLSDWATLSRWVSERWFYELQGLSAELYARLSLRPPMGATRLPSAQLGYDAASLYACFATWLPALVGEVLGTLRLGAAHVSGLRLRVQGRAPALAPSRGPYLAPEPPPLLLMAAALRTLEARGFHTDASAERAAFEASAAQGAVARLPLQDGAWLELDSALLVDLTEQVTDATLQHPFACLDGFQLREIPGFAHTAHERTVQRELAQELARAAPARPRPARLLGAVLLRAGRPGASEEALMTSLRHALFEELEVAPAAAGAAEPATSLAAGLRDREALVEAIVLSEALPRRLG